MVGYATKFLRNIYGFINPEYVRNERMKIFEELEKSGQLEGMCSSEVHGLFGIKKESSEF